MKTNKPLYPCRSCVYFAECGETSRTMPCKGRQTKTERKASEVKQNEIQKKKKEVNAGYNNKICVSYCGLQTLLTYTPERAYITRSEGWACDIYEVPGNNVIVTGYAPFGNVRADYKTCRKYEEKARKVLNKHYKRNPYTYKKRALDKLITQFVDEVIKGGEDNES